jgi:SAM-dependent methyltransferase
MSVFGDSYSKYYNLLYKDKNYAEEYQYIRALAEKYKNRNELKNVLDIGCGTGRHLSYFKKDGFHVSGVDFSPGMIEAAKKKLSQEENLLCCKASEFRFDIKFDLIISLFHVMNYQTETPELEKIFRNVSDHLAGGGLFIFDFWYGPAVLSDPPAVRIKRLEDEEVSITRIAEPEMNYNKNIVGVNFEVLIEDKKNRHIEKINETHNMRYFFLPEIEFLAESSGLNVIDTFEWMNFNELSSNTWYGVTILRKKQ